MPAAPNHSFGSPLSLKVIGHNAGTSMDGVDLVHVHFTQDSPSAQLNMQLLHYGEYPMPPKIKQRVMRLIKENKTTPEEMAIVNIQLGEVVGDAVIAFAAEQGFNIETEVDIIAGQGQTIWHLPLPELFEGDQKRAHLDMAEIATIAANTGATTIGNFRVSEMALGRQGCPLFAALDSLLLNDRSLNRAVQNIGGIANFSILPKGDVEGCYDFDTGPGNVFIDAAVRYFTNGKKEYDKDGATGAKGSVWQNTVDEVLAGPYFTHDIPKTTGRETFGDRMAEDICDQLLSKGAGPEDCVATITRITAQSLAEAYRRWGPPGGLDEIYMGGGGSYNPNIVSYLQEQFPQTRVTRIDEIGIPVGAKEAVGFALLGCECFVGRPMIVPKRTESDRPGVVGQVQPGSNHHRLRQHVARLVKHVETGTLSVSGNARPQDHAGIELVLTEAGDSGAPCLNCRQQGRDCSNGQPAVFSALQWRPEADYSQTRHETTASPGGVKIAFVDETHAVSQQYKVIADLPDLTTGQMEAPPIPKSSGSAARDDADSTSTRPAGAPITNKKDAFYMSRYVQFVGPWFDLFDNTDRHFSYVVPALALSNLLLRLSCLAAAARQHSLVSDCGDGDALLYYDEALRALASCLNDRAHETATFASCLLIAHCEMVESKANDWNLHLKGTRELVVAQGWHGSSGGLAQACFWIYCRMMILSSMSSGTPTPIDTAHWLPSNDFEDPEEWTADTWARKTVYMLGAVHNFLCRSRHVSDPTTIEADKRDWDSLSQKIRHHQTLCPSTCRPLSIVRREPLQEICYTNGSIAAAWQMYHALCLVHSIGAPSLPNERLTTLQAASSTAVEHAKLIVANSIFNRFDTAWVNAVQLLTTAGHCLAGWQLRHACMTILEDIRRTTGWKTRENLAVLFHAWDRVESAGLSVCPDRTTGLLLYLLEARDQSFFNDPDD
ncbi:uncharacterized protein LTR77_009092 [Saxophila tyrrhenica]|uniref:Anhydro-N-acetylmuramic acid kinase n=1 Tax=Saxophila tyrrhenica TaxID=1690608 RepID=A0AAV9NZM4_9PEZI|nr:hypothetical protein LTR77_009092 [Saxophila tyrrhenica]